MLVKVALWLVVLGLVGFYGVMCDDRAKNAVKSFLRGPLAR